MKKKLIILLLSGVFLLSGCAKKYNTISEYSEDMAKVRKGHGDYTIEAVILKDGQNLYYKSYIKNNKWKTELSLDNGSSYTGDGTLYDGNEVYSYSINKNVAMVIPFGRMFEQKGIKDKNVTEKVMKFINPLGLIYSWDAGANDLDTALAFGRMSKKNNFACRMITSTQDDSELCVSDKYGIAVYAKIYNQKNGGYVEYNVKKITNRHLSEYELELPAGIKKMSMADMFQDLANMMKNRG